ncbi:MAG: hypothetical protein ACRYFX_08570 [Janthinobacterium lividum]
MEQKLLAAWYGFLSGVLLAALALVTALSLSGCAAGRPVSSADAAPVLVDSAQVQRLDSLALRLALPDLSGLPPYLVPAPAGSSARQRRQWQRAQTRNLARAGVLPTKIKNSSVATAPGAVAITRPASAVAMGASTATDARKAGTRGGAAAVGPGAVATATSSKGPPWWVYLVVAVLGAVGWELFSANVAPVRALLRWRLS